MKASTKDIIREIKKSKMRFFYISSIIALGVAFFCGMKATSPSMIKTALDYFHQSNLSDFRLVSTYGIRDEDITRLSSIDGVEDVVGGYSTDQIFKSGDDKTVVKILSLPQIDGQNTPLLRDGRFPLNNNECVLEYDNKAFSTLAIGDTISILEEPNRDIPLHDKQFTIVGTVETPQYISLEHGNTNIGSGTIDAFLMVLPEDFDIERYTEAYIYTDISKNNIDPYSDEYSKAQEKMITELEQVGDDILEDNIFDIRVDALKEIGKAQQEYDTNKQEFDEQIASAEQELIDGQTALDDGFRQYYEGLDTFNSEIAKAEDQLSQAENQLAEGYSEYQTGLRTLAQEIAAGQNQLLQGRNELASGYSQYYAGLDEYNTSIALAEEQLRNARIELAAGFDEYQTNLALFNQQIGQAEIELQEAWSEYNAGLDEFTKQEAEYTAQIKQAQDQLDQGWQQYNQGKAEFDQKKKAFDDQISAAQAELDKQKTELTSKEDTFKAAQTEYETKLKEFEEAVSQLPDPEVLPPELQATKEQLEQTKLELDKAQEEITAGKTQLETAQKELDEKKATGEAELAPAEQQLKETLDKLNASQAEIDSQRAKLEAELAPIREQLEAAKADLETGEAELTSQKEQGQAQLDAGLKALQDGQSKLESGIAELEANKISATTELNESLKMLQDAEAQLTQGEQTLIEQEALGREQLNQAQAELISGEEQLNTGRIELRNQRIVGQNQLLDSMNLLIDNQNKLYQGRQEFEEQKADGERQLAEAQQKIDDAKEDVNNLDKGEWFVYSRDDNPGYTSYQEDSDRIDKIGNVFPLFFFLVAALVAFSTMTRMVEEERSQIGTLYALGFSKWQIIKKYVIYAGTAALIGATIGAILGILLLPQLIFTAYNILYNMPDLEITVPWNIVILSYIISLGCTVGAAAIIALVELRNVPAELMRPKAPKPGKRILMERIPIIWNRLNFISKVSARNIFRYKARFLMTTLGIAGCSALILAGFGLHDAIFTIIPNQFGTIFKYDQSLILTEAKDNLDTEVADLLKDERVSAALAAEQQSVDVETPDSTKLSLTLIIPEYPDKFPEFVSLHDRKNQSTTIPLTNEGVVVSEKMATNYGATPGSTIKINIDNRWIDATVSAQTENYLRNFVYISPTYYQEITGKVPTFSTIFINFSENAKDQATQDSFAEEKIESDTYASAINTASLIDQSEKMLNSLNIIVIVMIVSAGMLAFIVLNNLTNINISERMREIATLKVLGFRTGETNNYIFRENIILSLIGIIVGLGLGVLLLRYIIYTVELDIIMFGRKIFPASYIYSILLTLGFTIIVNFTMIPMIGRVNMVESLKDID